MNYGASVNNYQFFKIEFGPGFELQASGVGGEHVTPSPLTGEAGKMQHSLPRPTAMVKFDDSDKQFKKEEVF